jgi:hypothetical protein
MRLNQPVVGEHPATSGYQLECFVFSDEEGALFSSGSGTLNIEFPKFSITGIEFNGKNLLIQPTGEELLLMEDIQVLDNFITLKTFFSGDLNGNTGQSIQNIKFIDVYTGSDPTFAPDTLNFTNRIDSEPVLLQPGEESTFITINAEDIDFRVEENIFYKTIPSDYLTFGQAGDAVSGIMFGGFGNFSKITGSSDIIISRSTTNDLKFFSSAVTDIYTGVKIIISNDVPKDFVASFRIRTNIEDILISGSGGATLQSSSSDFNVSNNSITLPAGNDLAEFEISSLLDQNEIRTAFVVGES